MIQPTQYNYSPDELEQLQTLRASVADFKAIVDGLSEDNRNAEYNEQFNQLRTESRALLKGGFTEDVPKAITGDVSKDRSLSLIVILGVILALIGLGINAIVLEDVMVNSLGCCISSGGMLLLIGAFAVLAMKNVRERVTQANDLGQRCDLLLYQLDHALRMAGVGTPGSPAATVGPQIRPTSDFGPPPSAPEVSVSSPPPPPEVSSAPPPPPESE